ncbi:olfactory receptor-like protein DTMT [Xenopus laevis]|uniref:Olfactory receptor n=1 Tax=Xenopus laevis TaxID=8355 RepID=A0A8J0TT28_XENLA|nr:olfactory receptor-like protein DTMT [Xenopus laevis]
MAAVHGETMEQRNQTISMEFTLLGLSHLSGFRGFIFLVYVTVFFMTVLGNCLIIVAITVDAHLHTPMYFFLVNLSLLDMCYTSITVPNILCDIALQSSTISFAGCMSQAYLFTLCATVECMLLAAMACDRYVAICRPLHYTLIINRSACVLLAVFAWLCGLLNATINTLLTLGLVFCGANSIKHMYCEVQPLIRLSCSDTRINDICATLSAAMFGVGCLILILTSYFFIGMAIVRIPGQDGKIKAFSTCTSHIIVVLLYYGALIFMYLLPSASSSQALNMAVSMVYSTGTPMLNPIIYSLRNQQVKGALMKAMSRKNPVLSLTFSL